MNQNICPNCKSPNAFNQSFCASCGQPLFANNQPPNAPGFNANQPNFSASNQQPAPKKSRTGLVLGILGGVLLLGALLVGVGLFSLYYYFNSKKSEILSNYNSAVSNSRQSNITTTNTNSATINNSSSMTEDEKYRLFYAASKAGDQALTQKISKKIGIIDQSGKPTDYYKTFVGGMFKWAARDVEFVKKIDTKQKALDYINSQMPGEATSSNQETGSTPTTVSGGVLNGKASNLVQPAYPAAAKAVRASGAVNVQVTVDEEGNVTSASAISGHPLLRQSAEQAARASKFNPTVLNGKPVTITGIVVYNFTAE